MWRIIEGGKVRLTSRDHAQRFGLSQPVDAYREASSKLQGQAVVEVRLTEGSADLFIDFEDGLRLEMITDSSGYEPWNLRAPDVHIVACGGGGIANFSS